MTVEQYSYIGVARVKVCMIDNSDELYPPWLLDEDRERMTIWQLPDGFNNVNECCQLEWYDDFDEEWIRFRKTPVACFHFSPIRLGDHSIWDTHLTMNINGEYVDLNAQQVFGDCTTALKSVAQKDIAALREKEPYQNDYDSTFVGIFECTTWRVTPRWAQNDPECEWITETVSQLTRFLGVLDEGRIIDLIAKDNYLPHRGWWAGSQHNKVSVWPTYEQVHGRDHD